MIELVAIFAQQNGRKKKQVLGFERFLMEMEKLSTLVITIGAAGGHKKSISVITERFNQGKTVILDPSNSFSKLAKDQKPDVLEELEFQAIINLKVLRNFGMMGRYERVENPIENIFCHKIHLH